MNLALTGAPVEAVLFDYGNTLITVERPHAAIHAAYEEIERRLRATGHGSPAAAELLRSVHDRVEREFIEHQRSGALEEMDLTIAARRAWADLGFALDEQVLDEFMRLEQEAWWSGVLLVPDAVPTLRALRAAGARVGLCSNAPYRVRSLHDQLEHVGLRSLLDSVTFSAEIGWRKPAPQIFAAALRALGARPQSTVMVGDSIREDVEGARAAGLRAVLYDPAGRHPQPSVAAVGRLDQLPSMLGLVDAARPEARQV